MNADNLRKNAERWVRLSVLTLTTFGPIINVVSGRLRERTKAIQRDAAKQGPAVIHDLAERGSKTTQAVVAQGGDIVRDVAERGSKTMQEIAKQSQRTTREVSHRTRRVAKQAQREFVHRSAKVGEQIRTQATSPDDAARFWSVFGFSLGLTSAMVVVYLLLRRRLQQSEQANDSIQPSSRAMLNGSSATRSKSGTTNTAATSSAAVSTSAAPTSSTATVTPPSSTPPVITPAQDSTTVSMPNGETAVSDTTAEPSAAQALSTQDVEAVQEVETLPDTLPENTPALNATAEPLTASPENEGVISTPEDLPVEVPLQDIQEPSVATPVAQQAVQPTMVTDAIDTLPTAPLENAPETQGVSQTVATPGSPVRTYEFGSDAEAVSTGTPVVSIDDTVIPVEGLGTATTSGVISYDDNPDVEQDTVSNALSTPDESAVDTYTMVERVLAEQEKQAAASPVAGSALLGVVSTKRYYPIETPLSVLKPQDGSELDIIYFANENEARAQGYSAAE